MHQGRLTRPRRTHHRDILTRLHIQTDPPQSSHLQRAVAVNLRHPAQRQNRLSPMDWTSQVSGHHPFAPAAPPAPPKPPPPKPPPPVLPVPPPPPPKPPNPPVPRSEERRV